MHFADLCLGPGRGATVSVDDYYEYRNWVKGELEIGNTSVCCSSHWLAMKVLAHNLNRALLEGKCMADVEDELQYRVVEMGFPRRNSGAIGKMLDTYLRDPSYSMRDEAVHLLFSANRWEAMSEMLSHLAAGKHIGMLGSVGWFILFIFYYLSLQVGLPKPDMVVFLDLSPEAAARRGAYGEERYEKKEVQVKVRRMYTRFEKEPFWQIFDADKPAEEVTRKVTDAAIAVAQELEKDSIMSIDKIWWPKETNLEGVEFEPLDLSPGERASDVFCRGGGEAASVEPARKRRAELLASLAKRRRVEPSNESKPRAVGTSTLVVNIRQQLDVLDMNLEKNNGLVDFHQQQASRYFEEVLYWERRLNAVEKEVRQADDVMVNQWRRIVMQIEELLEKRMKVGKIKKYQADFARYVYFGNHQGHTADLRRDGIVALVEPEEKEDEISRARGA
ncbi:hypothetical protein FOL46_009838 [Perkinsus olseni]|uniref:Thymidylate kinase-like domain-containing protein n=1 Tax=Perkinsus olseni TaxID=32597 RepID=A0A7J6MJW1_PEROL|nr:hypothetical protein FOL46_009838 [Perkinsus olseni]